MSAEAAAKHPIKKIKPHVFRVEIIRILIKTLLGSGVAVTFKIGFQKLTQALTKTVPRIGWKFGEVRQSLIILRTWSSKLR